MIFDSDRVERRPPGWYNKKLRIPRYFTVFFFLVGIGLFGLGAWMSVESRRTVAWPTAPGAMLSSEVVRSGQSHTVKLVYRYTADGREYTGRRLFLVPDSGMSYDRAEWYVRRYGPGVRVVVYYDPDDPGLSVLEPGSYRGAALMIVMGLVFGFTGAYAFYQETRRMDEPAGLSRDEINIRAVRMERIGRWLSIGLGVSIVLFLLWALWPRIA